MLVDVILPTYRGKRWVANAVESVRDQTYPNWHLWIVDDASDDGTLEFLWRRYGQDDRITISGLPENQRTPGARMNVIRKASGGALAFIDQDDLWMPDKLARQVELLARSNVHAVHTDCIHIDAYGYEIPRAADRENTRRARLDWAADAAQLVPELYRASSIRIVSALIDRAAFDAVGGFDTVNYGVEEWEFWIRFAAQGYKMAHLPAPLFAHRDHATNASKIYVLERLRNVLHMADVVAQDYSITGPLVQRTKIWALRNIVINGLIQGRGAEVQEEIDALLRAGKAWAYGLRVLSWLPGHRVFSSAGLKLALNLVPTLGM